jgi:hypothetical protein
MERARVIGMLFLGVFLLLWGLITALGLVIPGQNYVLGTLAMVAGFLVLLGL